MNRAMVILTAAFMGGGPAVFAGEPQIPGTLNFENVTSSRINQTVSESASNEKEVDFGDFDNDGDLDVVIAVAHSDFGQRRNKLYRNDNGVFNEVSGAPIIPGFSGTTVSRNAFFRDYNGDGFLDIWIINDGNSQNDQLYVAQHDGDVFTHYVVVGQANTGAACSGVSIDSDMDGDFDVYMGNYPNSSQDRLYHNNGGIFTNVTGSLIPGDGDYTVDVASGDMNGDGTLDLLISNWGNNELYYNDRMGLGTQVGDYSYPGSIKVLGNASSSENAMEPGDFDGDGDLDIYWTNVVGAGDRILSGTINKGDGTVNYVTLDVLPPSVTTRITTKPTVFDLNGDGRVDVVVGGHTTRPTILRNTTVHGQISFVDWTPGDAFPNNSVHRGWHAAVFDSNGDGAPDIFLGGWTNDHLFENSPSNEVTEDEVAGILPGLFNLDPIALVGTAGVGETDAFTATGIGSGSFISVVLNGANDYLLEVLDGGNTVIASSDRGGLGIEEALQVTTSAGSYTIQVTTQECAAIADLSDDCNVGASDLLSLLVSWGPCKGCPADFDGDGNVGASDLLVLLVAWGPSEYVLEVLSRSGP